MRFSIYNTSTGEVVRTITCSKQSQAQANCAPGEAVSQDAPPRGKDDRDFKVDPARGKHRNKTAAEKHEDNAKRELVRDQMWEKEEQDRAAHRQTIINSGATEQMADAVMQSVYGTETRKPKERNKRRPT
jgi:hypothetical protein